MEGTQQCRNCHQVLPVEKFKMRGGRQSGQRFTMCNRCLYVRYTRPSADKKMSMIHQYQLDRGCADCGYREHPAALEFDHRPGEEKLFNIGEQMGNRSMDVLWAEIAKCDVVCSNCHNIRTHTRRIRLDVPLDALPLGRIPAGRG
jgi:hypothetical protein